MYISRNIFKFINVEIIHALHVISLHLWTYDKVQYNYSIFKPIQYLYLIISRILYNATLIYKLELCV